jgi:hypothetical protein
MTPYETTHTCNIKLKQRLKYSKVTTKPKLIKHQFKKHKLSIGYNTLIKLLVALAPLLRLQR